MPEAVFNSLCTYLQSKQAPFDVLRHAPVYTSEEAAQVRGTPLSSGAKALICKADDRFVMIVLPADRKLNSKAVRKLESIKSLRFASKEEVLELTGLTPGSIPPFGGLFNLPTLCDQRLSDNAIINFNAGDHAISLSMAYTAYLAAEQPKLGLYAE